MSTRRAIIAAAFVTEAVLVAVSLAISVLYGGAIQIGPSVEAALIGAFAAFPLLVLNHLLWRRSLQRPASLLAKFSREVIIPLCRELPPGWALVVALLSGGCEELLFRGALNSVCLDLMGQAPAALITSVLFAYVHFIGSMRRYGGLVPLYTAVGLYLWAVCACSGSLFAAMAAHATYNFLAILLIRRSTALPS